MKNKILKKNDLQRGVSKTTSQSVGFVEEGKRNGIISAYWWKVRHAGRITVD